MLEFLQSYKCTCNSPVFLENYNPLSKDAWDIDYFVHTWWLFLLAFLHELNLGKVKIELMLASSLSDMWQGEVPGVGRVSMCFACSALHYSPTCLLFPPSQLGKHIFHTMSFHSAVLKSA